MESFGKYLKGERERRGISLDEISRVTKIGPGQLKAMENDDLGALPPIAFVKGFVRSYSRHIGIDPDEAIIKLEQYLSEIEGEEDSFGEKAVRQFRRAAPDPRMMLATVVAIILVILAAIVITIRSCGKENNVKPTTSEWQQKLSHSEYPKDESPFVYSGGESENPALPTVPPRAFRIYKSGPPQRVVTSKDDRETSEDYSAGGPTSPSAH